MRAIRLVACHRGDLESFEKTPLCRSAKGRFPLYVCLENTQGLPLRYNQFLTGAWEAFTLVGEFDRESAPDDILVFLHDDVEIVSNNVEPELNRWAERGYAILGLAGAARVRILMESTSPCLISLTQLRSVVSVTWLFSTACSWP